MSRNAVELFEFNEEKFRLRGVFDAASRHMDVCAEVIADSLLDGASQDHIDAALALYARGKAARELAWQEYRQFTLPPLSPDSD